MYEHLFSPFSVRGLTVKNRVVLPGIGTKMSKDRHVTDQLIAFHVARVKGGCGLNVLEVASVHAPSAPQGFLGIHDDDCIPGLKKIVDAIHEAGGKASIQLWQGGINVMWDPSAAILLPSELKLSEDQVIPAISTETIWEVVEAYGKAAERARKAGFDAVELHAAHSYLPHTFLSGAFNHRDDEFGGSLENRMKFPLAVIDAIRAGLSDDMPLFMRIDAHDDFVEEGLTIEEVIEFCKQAHDHGVDVLNVSRGNTTSDALQFEVPPIDLRRGINVPNARRIKEETGMPVMVAGRINTPDYADRVIARGSSDLVGIARGQIADPCFCEKAATGRDSKITHCIGCNQGCYDAFTDFSQAHISCMRNPVVGRELECSFTQCEKPEDILVAGGGVAGMEAALLLAQRGHKVVISEKSDHLGGRFLVAGEAPRKGEMARCSKEMAQAVMDSSIEVILNSDARDVFSQRHFDRVVCAIGAEPNIPPIKNIDAPWVYQAEEVLTGNVFVSGEVAVIGGGLVGLEAAELCAQQGCKVTVLEMTDSVENGLGDLRKICVKHALAEEKVAIKVNATVTSVTEEGLEFETPEGKGSVAVDYVILAAGYSSQSTDVFVSSFGKDAKVEVIGDALRPRKAIDAIREGFNLALAL